MNQLSHPSSNRQKGRCIEQRPRFPITLSLQFRFSFDVLKAGLPLAACQPICVRTGFPLCMLGLRSRQLVAEL